MVLEEVKCSILSIWPSGVNHLISSKCPNAWPTLSNIFCSINRLFSMYQGFKVKYSSPINFFLLLFSQLFTHGRSIDIRKFHIFFQISNKSSTIFHFKYLIKFSPQFDYIFSKRMLCFPLSLAKKMARSEMCIQYKFIWNRNKPKKTRRMEMKKVIIHLKLDLKCLDLDIETRLGRDRVCVWKRYMKRSRSTWLTQMK